MAFVPIAVLVFHSVVHAAGVLRSLRSIGEHMVELKLARGCWMYYIGFVNVVFG